MIHIGQMKRNNETERKINMTEIFTLAMSALVACLLMAAHVTLVIENNKEQEDDPFETETDLWDTI